MLYEIPGFFLKISALYVIFVNTSVAASNNSLCFVGEKQTFSCAIKNKTVSICETDTQDFFYRYGTRESIEMNISRSLNYSSAMFSGGGESRLTFNNGAFDYVVFSAIYSLGPATPEKDMKAGIIVVKEGTEVNRLLCTNPVYADFELSLESSKKILDYKANAEKFIDY